MIIILLIPIFFAVVLLWMCLRFLKFFEKNTPQAEWNFRNTQKKAIVCLTLAGITAIGIWIGTFFGMFVPQSLYQYSQSSGFKIPSFMLVLPWVIALLVFCLMAVRYTGQLKKTGFVSPKLSYFIFILGYLPLGLTFLSVLGGLGWGRPLRIKGKIVSPDVKEGDDWCHDEKVNTEGIDSASKKALESLWLHDAKKEFASIPAFSRLTWQLTLLGAPPDLLRDLHVAGIQEIDHTRRCLALASSFGSHKWTVCDIPEIISKFDNIEGDPFVSIAKDSLIDGCLLEGFNADTAVEAAKICKDPVSLSVIEKIAREERFHADISWRILAFCFQKNPIEVKNMLLKEVVKLAQIKRPTATSQITHSVVAAANPSVLVQFGRLPDDKFDKLWNFRIQSTQEMISEVISTQGKTDFSFNDLVL